MKIIKYLFFLLLLVFIGSAIYFGTKDGSYDIQDTITIKAPTDLVFDKVNNLETWEEWSPWRKEDSKTYYTKTNTTSGEGASISWSSDESGTISTTKVIPNKEIEQQLILNSQWGDRDADVTWNFEDRGDETEVTWTIKGEHSLIHKILLTLRNSNYEKQFHQKKETALELLSTEVTKAMEEYTINVDGLSHYGGGYYMYTTSVASQSEVHEKMLPMIKLVKTFMDENNIPASGEPFLLYNEIDSSNNTVIFSTCYPVRERIVTPESSSVVSGYLEPVSAVRTTLKGNYKNIPEAYREAHNYIHSNGYDEDLDKKEFEIYLTNPEEVRNPAEWLTEIYIPIAILEDSDSAIDAIIEDL